MGHQVLYACFEYNCSEKAAKYFVIALIDIYSKKYHVGILYKTSKFYVFFIKNWKNLPFSDLKVSGFGSISNPDQSLFTSTA